MVYKGSRAQESGLKGIRMDAKLCDEATNADCRIGGRCKRRVAGRLLGCTLEYVW